MRKDYPTTALKGANWNFGCKDAFKKTKSLGGAKITAAVLLLLCFSLSLTSFGQYSAVPLTSSSFNVDLVADGANGAASNSTTAAVDGTVAASYVFVTTDFNPGSGVCTTTGTGLPASRTITSTNATTATGITYTLQPYGSGAATNNNAFQLTSLNSTGTITPSAAFSASKLYFVCLGGGGATTFNVTLNFSDGTTQVINGLVADDWCSATVTNRLTSQQYFRIPRNATACTSGGTCQYLFEIAGSVSAANFSKTINSIGVTWVSGGQLAIMAMGKQAVCTTAPSAPTSFATALTAGGTISAPQITGTVNAAAGPPTGYLVVRYPAGAATTAPATGTTYTAGQSIGSGTVVQQGTGTAISSNSSTGLKAGTTYDFYVYSYQTSATCGGPIYSATALSQTSVSTVSCAGPSSPTVIQITAAGDNTITNGFTSIANALGTAFPTSLGTTGISAPVVLELQTGYAVEATPITITNNGCFTSTNKVTIRPAAAVSSPFIFSSTSTSATFILDGANYITIDGRNGGSGSNKYIRIINTSSTAAAAGNAVLLRNDAFNNTLTYLDLQASNLNPAANSGTVTAGAVPGAVSILSTTGSVGNDNNTISYCDIHSVTSSGNLLNVGIYAYNATTVGNGSNNDNNTITNCNIYDIFNASTTTAAINVLIGNNNYTITNNSVYKSSGTTFTYSTAGITHRGFWITPGASTAGSSGFTISGNYIGGTAASCGGTAYTMAGNVTTVWQGMDISVGSLSTTSVSNNIIQNINFTTTSTANPYFAGISIASGNVNVGLGSGTGNKIGSATGNGSIIINNSTTSLSTSTAYGIRFGGGAAITANYDTVGSITINNGSISNSFVAIGTVGGGSISASFSNNIIGSTGTSNSIQFTGAGASTTAMGMCGIFVSSGPPVSTINNNTIANVTNTYTGTSSTTALTVRGIDVAVGINTIDNNTIRNLQTASTIAGSGSTANICGIVMRSTTAPSTVTNNKVYSLLLTTSSTTTAPQITGIYWSGATGGTNLIAKNFIHSFDVSFTTTTSTPGFTGIDVAGGNANFQNNMIRLGINDVGNSVTTPVSIRGIAVGSTATDNFYFNTVYIGGTGVTTGSNATFGFRRSAVGVHDVRDNIFANVRSNASGSAKHYAIGSAGVALTTLTPDYNLYQYSGTGGLFALANATDVSVYNGAGSVTANWVSTDVNGPSGSQDPQFLVPSGTSSTLNLHISPSIATAVEGGGVAIAGITDDFDGDTRSSVTPTDIGADAGLFIPIPACSSITINPGSAVASSVTACTASLSLTGNTTQATGLSYQWQSRTPSGSGPYSNISGATTITYTANLAGATTDFQCVISCSGGSSVTSSPVTVTAASPGVAAGYSPLAATGWNKDVIADGVGALNTCTNANAPSAAGSGGVDGIGWCFYDQSYKLTSGSAAQTIYLPVNGQIFSASVTGLLYNLQPSNQNNVLQLAGLNTSGTLTLTSPQSGTSVYLLATGGSGACTISGTITFTDNSTQSFTASVPDWFGSGSIAQAGFGRVQQINNGAISFGGAANTAGTTTTGTPRMFDVTFSILPANYSKAVQSISVTNTTSTATATANVVNIFGVSMAVPSPTAFCGNLATSVTLFNPPSGATYQWQSSSTSGTGFTNIASATSSTYTNPSPTGPVYYRAQVTCPVTGYTSPSSEAFLSITAVPTVSVSPTTANYCSGTTGVTLTASGNASSYSWSPSAGLDNVTGASVIATPSATTTYTVTGITNSCTNTATTTITYVQGPTINSVTATPASICTGQTSQLQAIASTPTLTYCIPTISNTSLHYVANFALNGASSIISNLSSGAAGTTNNYKDYGTTKTTGSLAAGTTYSIAANDNSPYGGFAVWVDYNQNGTFENSELVWSQYTNSGTVINYTGTFTVPSSAYNGNTKLRIRNDYNEAYNPSAGTYSCNPGGSDGSSTYGETEDYTVTITGATAPPGGVTYAWTPSATLSSSSIYNPVANPATGSTTYKVTASYNGCSVSDSVTVVKNNVPSAPTGTDSVQCGTMAPKAFVTSTSGLSNPTFNWYDAATNGNLLQSSTSTTYTTPISATTTFYVAEVGAGGCESTPRTPVTVSVTSADPISITGPSTACIGLPIAMSVNQTGSNNNYDFTWSATPAANSGVSGTPTGTSQSFTPIAGGSFVYKVTGVEPGTNCQQIATLTVSVTDLVAQGYTASATASQTTVCAGTNVTLTGTFKKAGTATLGTGTGVNATNSNVGAAYPTYYGNGRQQYLVLASELTALGLKAGNITALAFKINSTVGAPSAILNGYTIKIGSTTATSITTFQSPSFTTVWGPINYTPTVNAVNTHTFSTPYNWDGTSNLIIDICFSNQVLGSTAYQSFQTSTAFSSTVYYQADNAAGAGACSSTTVTGTGSIRPNMTFTGNLGQAFSSYSWSDGTTVVGTTNPLTVSPAVNTTYTITGTHSSGCNLTASVPITANPLPSVPTGTNSTQCGVAVPTASVSSTSGLSNPQFKWYTTDTGTVALTGQTGSSLSGYSINTTTDFYVSEISSSGCESKPRVKVTANVTQPDAVSLQSASASCIGSAVSFTANKTGSANNYTYTWSATPSGGSGLSGSPTGTSQTFTPTVTGTYVYKVTAYDVGSNCTAIALDTVKVYQGLSGTVSATQITSCTNPTGLITANVSGAGTVVNNDFSSTALPAYMDIPATVTVNGTTYTNDANITGGRLELTPAVNSKKGGVIISNTTGLASNDFQIDFDFITTSGGVTPADGLSYSYGDDVVAFPTGSTSDGTGSPWAENGSGTKLKLSFDAINNTGGCGTTSGVSNGNVAGVYLMYNLNQNSQTTTCPGVLYYSPDVSWRATSTSGATTHVTIKINAAGQVSMLLNNVLVVNNVQLPASYLTADKSTWKHAFAARTGGLNEGHYIDNLIIQYNNFYEYSINGGSTWTTTNPIIPPASGTYPVTARYVSVPACSATLGNAVINTPVYTTTSTSATYCTYSSTTPTLGFTPAFTGASYQWQSSPAGANSWSNISGATSSTYTPSAASLASSTDYRITMSCSGTAAIGSPSVPISITSETPIVSATTGASKCGPGSVDLQATVSSGATAKWYTAATGGTAIGTGSPFTTPNNSATTTYYVSAVTTAGCESGRTAVTATINPVPSVADQAATICSGTAFTVAPTGVPAGTTYTWGGPTHNSTITGSSAQPTAQPSISQTLVNSSTTVQTASYIVTPLAGTCPGVDFTITVTVNPSPAPGNDTTTICSGNSFSVTPSGVPSGTTYTWTAPVYSGSITGGSAQASGQSTISQTLTNTGSTVGTGTYTVTPAANNCTGNAFTIVVKVNPKLVPSVTIGITKGQNPTCSGGSVTFTATPVNGGSSPTYQWYRDGVLVPGATTDTFTVNNVTPSYNPTAQVLMTVTPGLCLTKDTASSNSIDLTAQVNAWTGAISNSWSDGRNWCSGTVPTSTTDVTIPVLSSSRYPVVNNVASCKNLNIVSGAKVVLGSYFGAGPLTIYGQLTGTGTFSTGTSTPVAGANANLIFAGTGALGTLKLTPGSYALNTLSLTGTGATLTLGDTVKIVSKVDVGSNTLATGGFMTIKSDNYGTGNVAPINGGNITGNVTVERFVPANGHAAWRLLSVPTQTTQTFHQSWQENKAPMVVGTPGLGTLITGPAGASGGFDAVTQGASLLKFSQVTGGSGSFTAIGSTNTAMVTTLTPTDRFAGFFLYVRGDRTVQPSGGVYPPTATTLRTNGPLYIGTQPTVNVPANTNVVVGNIYASAVDFASMVKSNINSFKVWDPKLLGTYNLGAYQTFSAATGYDPVPGGGSYGSTPNSRIESGQAFIVSSASGGSIQFTEAAKTIGSRNVFRTSNTIKQFKTNLYAETANGPELADGNSVVFDNSYSTGVDEADVIKAHNIGEDLAIQSNGSAWVIEGRKDITEEDVIQFNIKNLKQQTYTFEFLPTHILAPLTGYLEDKFAGTKTPISMTDATTVKFTVTANAGSKAEDRFKIVFTNRTGPVMTTEVKAYVKNRDVQVDWKVKAEQNVAYYEVEHSTNGSNFSKAGTVSAKTNAATDNDYGYVHSKAVRGDNWYRIKTVSTTGEAKYSNVAKITIGKDNSGFSIYPNPIVNSKVNIKFSNKVEGRYSLRLLNDKGELVYNTIVDHRVINSSYSFSLSSAIAAGTYRLEIVSPTGERVTGNLIIANK